MAKKRPSFWFEEPFDEFRRMQEDFFGSMEKMFKKQWSSDFKFPEFKTRFIPVRIGETDKELVLIAELPGFSKDEIKLKITPKTVFISAEKKKISIEKNKNLYKQERSYGSASRDMTLPEEVNTEGAKAKFENGVLEVTMPKKEVKKKEEKEIKVE